MRKLLLIFAMSSPGSICFSQDGSIPVYKDTTSSFESYLYTQLSKEMKKDTSSSVLETYGFMRFKIDTMGNIIDIGFSERLNQHIKSILTEKASALKAGWCPGLRNNQKIVSDYFLLPLLICRNSKGISKSTSGMDFLNFLFFGFQYDKNSPPKFGESRSKPIPYLTLSTLWYMYPDESKIKPNQKMYKSIQKKKS